MQLPSQLPARSQARSAPNPGAMRDAWSTERTGGTGGGVGGGVLEPLGLIHSLVPGPERWALVGMCANKVVTTYHLIGTTARGYIAQSTGRIGLSNKNNSESHCQGKQELQLGF
jgi:hypothetical protein